MNHFSLSISLVISLSLSLPLNVEPPWEGGGATLGTTPHPTMLLNACLLSHHQSYNAHHPHHNHHVYLYHDYHRP